MCAKVRMLAKTHVRTHALPIANCMHMCPGLHTGGHQPSCAAIGQVGAAIRTAAAAVARNQARFYLTSPVALRLLPSMQHPLTSTQVSPLLL